MKKRFIYIGIMSVLITVVSFFIFIIIPKINTKNTTNPLTYERLSIGGGGAFYLPQINPLDKNNYIVCSDMGGLYWSINKGKYWNRTETKGVFTSTCFATNGYFFGGSYGLYVSKDKGKTIERIYPLQVIDEISRAEYNENLYLSPSYDNGYMVAVTTYNKRVYFITITYELNLKVMSCDYDGSNLNTLFEKSYTGKIDSPSSCIIDIVVDENGVYYSDQTNVNLITFSSTLNSPNIQSVYEGQGLISQFKKINDYYFILDDITNETLVLKTNNFINNVNINNSNNLSNYYIWDNELKFDWHFNHIAGNNINNLFLTAYSNVENSYCFYGLIKIDNNNFYWVYDNAGNNTLPTTKNIWSKNCHGPMYGLNIDPFDEDHILMSNIETVYSIEFDFEETKRKVEPLHCIKSIVDEENFYKSTGLDCQTTYSVQEDPFDKDHIAFCTTDLGLQLSYDGGKTFRRYYTQNYDANYNTCYDLYFDKSIKNKVYGIWSSKHDAPYRISTDDRGEQNVTGHFAVSYDGGITWDFNYSSGIPKDSVMTKMSIVNNDSKLTIAVCTFNNGFYISYNNGKNFECINEGMDSYDGFIWGSDVVIVDNKVYCLTTHHFFRDELTPSYLYEYNINSKTLRQIDLGEIVIARSLTYNEKSGLLINVVSYFKTQWFTEYDNWFWINYGGGIYQLQQDGTIKSIFSGESIYNSKVTSDGTIYASSVYGKIYKGNTDGDFNLYIDNLFYQLKNISFSSDELTLYVTSFGGGVIKIPIQKD